MLVDKVVELARALKEFPELGLLDDAEQERQVQLFAVLVRPGASADAVNG